MCFYDIYFIIGYETYNMLYVYLMYRYMGVYNVLII